MCLPFPRLKNALLCRILVYVVVIGAFAVPAVIVVKLPFVPDGIKALACIGAMAGCLVYAIKNFCILMELDILFATLHCYNTARACFTLPRSFSAQSVRRRISRFGHPCIPTALVPQPQILRYKSSAPMTIYSSGIEKLMAVYSVELLDQEQYRLIVSSAKANARALKGAKKHRFLDRAQRSAPLHQVIVIVILADRVEEQLRTELSDTVGKGGGDGSETAALPCVVDLERRSCTFDSMRLPYVGFGYPVKNRGIRLIRRYLFGGRFPYAASPQTLPPIVGLDPEQTLWRFWRELRDEPDSNNRKTIKRFKKMQHGDMTVEDGYLYLKWQDHGIGVPVKLHTDARTVEVGAIDQWLYPKANKIAKSTVESIKDMIDERFAAEGCAVTYTIDT